VCSNDGDEKKLRKRFFLGEGEEEFLAEGNRETKKKGRKKKERNLPPGKKKV